ncbi:MAG TPA: hypothetical protein VGH89_30370 [Pseudonocardia sp.]|jgi:hypothetical protein
MTGPTPTEREITEELAAAGVLEPPPWLVRRWQAALAVLPPPGVPVSPPAGPVMPSAGAVAPPAGPIVPLPGAPGHSAGPVMPLVGPVMPVVPLLAGDGLAATGGGRHRAAEVPPNRRSGRRWPGRLAGVGVAASVVGLLWLGPLAGPGPVGVAPARPAGPVGSVDPLGLGDGGVSALSRSDPGRLGELDDPLRRAGCFGRLGVTENAVLDARRIDWHGRPAVRLVVASTRVGQLRVLVVAPGCGPGAASVLADLTHGP